MTIIAWLYLKVLGRYKSIERILAQDCQVLDENNVFFNYKNNVYLKLLPNLVRLGHVGDTLVKVDVLNNSF